MRLKDFKVGDQVTYIPFKGCSTSLYEYGVVTSINEKYIFVKYGADKNSKATNPSDLTKDF